MDRRPLDPRTLVQAPDAARDAIAAFRRLRLADFSRAIIVVNDAFVEWTSILPKHFYFKNEAYSTLDEALARLEGYLGKRAVFKAQIFTTRTETTDFSNSFEREELVTKAVDFWNRSREEFVRKTWAPDRHVDWCLAEDDKRDLGI